MPTISVSSTTKLTKNKKTNTNCSCFLHLVQQQTLKKNPARLHHNYKYLPVSSLLQWHYLSRRGQCAVASILLLLHSESEIQNPNLSAATRGQHRDRWRSSMLTVC